MFCFPIETSMLEKFQPAKADPILGLGKLYQADPRDGKIDLGVGVYKDASGNTPIVRAVKQAEDDAARVADLKNLCGTGWIRAVS
jgi:aspartate/tyrosine/aromatic aminotransferase